MVHFGLVILKLLELVGGLAERRLVGARAIKVVLEFLGSVVLACGFDLANYVVGILRLLAKIESRSLSRGINSQFLEIFMTFPIGFRPIMLRYINN